MPIADRLNIILGPQLAAAISDHCEAKGIKPAAFIRTAIARALKRPELADTVEKPGRRWPKK